MEVTKGKASARSFGSRKNVIGSIWIFDDRNAVVHWSQTVSHVDGDHLCVYLPIIQHAMEPDAGSLAESSDELAHTPAVSEDDEDDEKDQSRQDLTMHRKAPQSIQNEQRKQDEDVLEGEENGSESDAERDAAKDTEEEAEEGAVTPDTSDTGGERGVLEIIVPAAQRPWDYQSIDDDMTVDTILEELTSHGDEIWYNVLFTDGSREEVAFDELLDLRNGRNALDIFNNSNDSSQSEVEIDTRRRVTSQRSGQKSRQASMPSGLGKRSRGQGRLTNFMNLDDERDELSVSHSDSKKRKLTTRRKSLISSQRRSQSSRPPKHPTFMISSEEESSEDEEKSVQSRTLLRRGSKPAQIPASSSRTTRSLRASQSRPNYSDLIGLDEREDGDIADELLGDGAGSNSGEGDESDIWRSSRNVKQPLRVQPPTRGKRVTGRPRGSSGRQNDLSSDSSPERPMRVSARSNKASKSMRERLEDEEMFAEDITEKGVQVISIREVFQPLPSKSEFRTVHNKRCDVCDGHDNKSNKGPSPLIFCQGCSTAIHRTCLGYRSAREHVVTKIGDDNFVMQCRRCVGVATKKDPTAPHLDVCSVCKNSGASCAAFSQKKTSKQEEKIRQENGGRDPITTVASNLINNTANILFRCTSCKRGFHFEHIAPSSGDAMQQYSIDGRRKKGLENYSRDWNCEDCRSAPEKIQTLVAWRPANIDSYVPGHTYDMLSEDEKEYLVKWESLSYYQCTWKQGSWVWGVTAPAMRSALGRRDEGANLLPKMSEREAIPEEYLRIEIVLDVRYSSRVTTRTEKIDKARIREVDEVFVKFQGLGYEEVVWENPPSPAETDRWDDFVAAYEEFLAGKYFKQPEARMKERLQGYRELNFEKKILMDKQPTALTGGEMMPYQTEGLNWLLYNFHQGKNVILADEMGLGKTIQVIAAITALIKVKPKCWPFLIVVPNSTCPNWRREIKKWAPSLRVVAYYGSRQARDMAMKYELFPDGCSDLRAHVVVTSYEAPVDDNSRSFFKKIKWAGMVIDEGQRLKNDQNLLYRALSELKVPFRALLTGTPLQNNKRELFNLLHFLDTTVNAAELDEKYAELTNANLLELHNMIRPFFLRRTKAQVLKFLPPMAQVIVPLTMSVVQKKLYKSILSKSPDLIKSIFVKDQAQLKRTERSGLNNLLMQLRKCLCHPFVYSEAIEERSVNHVVLHRNLVDASSKLQLLELLLPKLQERGHRVLIFSQFLKQLDIIEDFLDGLGLRFQRLDGTIGTLEKQRRIDEYNAPDSPLFAFLLSTRAGGVGINLATADTVIIMDPDFNPHQDIQALSRAHRLGQKKKVLVFQLMTKDSAEEKIVQIGRKKMALDHVLIESMDADDDAGMDLQSILKHGAQALFDNDDRNDIHYDAASVDRLLDRTKLEDTSIGDDKSAESQFSHARIWATNTGQLTDDVGDVDSEESSNSTVWDKILKQREADAAREAAAQQKEFGRGQRRRQIVDYHLPNADLEDESGPSPEKMRTVAGNGYTSDTDFASAGDTEEEPDSDGPDMMDADLKEMRTMPQARQISNRNTENGQSQISPQGTRKKLFTPRSTPRKAVPKQKVASKIISQGRITSKDTPSKKGTAPKKATSKRSNKNFNLQTASRNPQKSTGRRASISKNPVTEKSAALVTLRIKNTNLAKGTTAETANSVEVESSQVIATKSSSETISPVGPGNDAKATPVMRDEASCMNGSPATEEVPQSLAMPKLGVFTHKAGSNRFFPQPSSLNGEESSEESIVKTNVNPVSFQSMPSEESKSPLGECLPMELPQLSIERVMSPSAKSSSTKPGDATLASKST
ncbi:MAG: hypothetical protein M1818_004471 [Claussenomyces sp. TS43310]|nr:MAG: hypothetical protein M1818_004471 [Claussenomyces sp. TS43310]